MSGGADNSGACLGFDMVGSAEAAARVSFADVDGSVEPKCSDNANESVVSKLENVEARLGDGSGGDLDSQRSSSVSKGHGNGRKKSDLPNSRSEHKRVKTAVEDYDSILSEFDQYAAKGVGEAVGYGYEMGNMVWGKVKSHPWWPGYIYDEAFASPFVQKSKRKGRVLVAFFGDSSYGWFELAELVPFEENFAEKSRQTSSRSFLKAVEEAVDEFSRRRSLGLACRCRNEFNFWPSSVEGYFVVDVGDYEPGVYSVSQITKARENFRPKDMLSFVQQLALTPLTNQHGTIEFIENKAMVLACRKALFEEFDETYAQAFGTIPMRPPRPTMPVAVDPTKAPLRGPLVIAEALGKGKPSAKPTKEKGQVEEDKYLLKRRDEPFPLNIKKAGAGQPVVSAPFLVDGSGPSRKPVDSTVKGHISVTDINDNLVQATSNQAFIITDIKPSEGSSKIAEGGIKKAEVHKQNSEELSAGNATLVEKKKKRKKDTRPEQPAGELSAANVTLVEKKKKKREKDTRPEQPAGELSATNVTLVEKKKKKKRKKDTRPEQPAGELSAANVTLVEKKKKKKRREIRSEASADKLPVANSNSGVAVDKVSGMPPDVPLGVKNLVDAQKKDGAMGPSSSPIGAQQAGDLREVEFPVLVRDLLYLALNPFHEVERGCPAKVQQVFLKYRSLVYQKSLVAFPSESEKSEAHLLAASTALRGPTDKTNDKAKPMKPLARTDDPTIGGKKRGPSNHLEAIKKKKLNEEEVDRRKMRVDSVGIKKRKIIGDLKSTSVEKQVRKKSTESCQESVKEIASKTVLSRTPKAVKLESSKRTELPARIPNPTMLVMKFPSGAALPSGAELRAKFARFGPMDHSATRVFWKSYTCRLVFRHKVDAQAALKYALGSSNLFGNTNVRSYIRELGVEAAEAEAVKVQKEGTSQPRDPAAKTSMQQQLKSCLKKPSTSEEGGNGNGRGTRVKFVLGGEGSIKTEQLSSIPDTSSYAHSMDVRSKNLLQKLVPQSSSVTPTPPSHQLQKFPINNDVPCAEPPPRSFNNPQMPNAPNNDISQQFLNLLTRCSDVVNNLTGLLGYMPYHSL